MPGDGWTTARIVHVAERDAWERALAAGEHYAAPSLEAEGFVHCSTPWQVVRIANVNFPGRDDLVLLVIAPSVVDARVVFENCEGGIEPFPHIYGAVPVAAVEHVRNLVWDDEAGSYEFPDGWS